MSYAKIAWAGSLGLMLGALFFEYVMMLEPCVLCWYQRYPHILAIVLGGLAIWRAPKAYPLIGLIVLISAGVALFHVGVEQHWWAGLSTCAGDQGLSVTELLGKPAARCDEIAWSFLGLSMAAWNGIFSVLIAGLWVRAQKN